MEKIVDMSPQAVTNRMLAQDGLWKLTVALKSSRIMDESAHIIQEPSEKPEGVGPEEVDSTDPLA